MDKRINDASYLYGGDLWRMGQEERAFEEAHPQVVDDTAT